MGNATDECAEALAHASFEVADVTFADVLDLALEVGRCLDVCRVRPQSPLQRYMRVSGIDVDYEQDGRISRFSIMVCGSYFSSRACIEVDAPRDVLVGSWCDSKNVIPFQMAFMAWLDRMEKDDRSVVGLLADKVFARKEPR